MAPKAVNNKNKQQEDAADEGKNERGRWIVIIVSAVVFLVISLLFGIVYRQQQERRRRFESGEATDAGDDGQQRNAGESVAMFAHRIKARIASTKEADLVGLVQHERVGGFALQIQGTVLGNTSLVSIPASSCLDVTDLSSSSSNNINNITSRLNEKRVDEFDSNKEILAQLGHDPSTSDNDQKDISKEALWNYVQNVALLAQLKLTCSSSSSTTKEERSFCPWINYIVTPSVNKHLPLSNLRWRPQIMSRCLRPHIRRSWEASTIQISALTSFLKPFFFSSSSPSSSSSLSENALEFRRLIEWSVFVLRTRSHRVSKTKTILIPLLDMNDKRIGAHLYRRSSKQHSTATIVFLEKENSYALVSTETLKRGSYPLTDPASSSSSSSSSSFNEMTMLEQFGVSRFSEKEEEEEKNNRNKKGKSESEEEGEFKSRFVKDNQDKKKKKKKKWFAVAVDWKQFLHSTSSDSSDSTNCPSHAHFDFETGEASPQLVECLLNLNKNKNNNNNDKEKDTTSTMLVSLIQHFLNGPTFKQETLFGCRSLLSPKHKRKSTYSEEERLEQDLIAKQASAILDIEKNSVSVLEKALARASKAKSP